MSWLKGRIKKLEEKRISDEKKEILIIVTYNPPSPEEEEALKVLPESVRDWLTFKEEAKSVDGRTVFYKDPLREMKAREKEISEDKI